MDTDELLTDLPFTYDELQEAIEEGLVTQRWNEDETLMILNYSNLVQYSRNWTEVTKNCRGLILDKDYNVIARPFPKIFNYGEWAADDIPLEFPTVQEKMDGSLIIVVNYKGERVVATRGSFESDQAKWSREWLDDNYPDFLPPEGITFLFECIYPENRICVNYGDSENLTCLAVIENNTGADLVNSMWQGDSVTWNHLGTDAHTIVSSMNNNPVNNREGCVLVWPKEDAPSVRIKVKYEEYVRLHGIIHSFSNKKVWEVLSEGGDFLALLQDVPDEFYTQVKGVVQGLSDQYLEIDHKAMLAFQAHSPYLYSKKEFALAIKDHDLKAILFRMYDNKPYDDIIWKMIKPKGE